MVVQFSLGAAPGLYRGALGPFPNRLLEPQTPSFSSTVSRGRKWSGRADSNRRPLDPQSSALTRLRYAPDRSSHRLSPTEGLAERSRFAADCNPNKHAPLR